MLSLRPYKRGDAKTIVSWITDEKSFYQWSAGRYPSYPITAEDMNTHYDQEDENPDFWQMTAFDEDGICGHLMMRFLSKDKKILRFGYIIVRSDLRGRGYGRRMLRLAASYAFDYLHVERITLGVFDNNPPAIRCYQTAGFKIAEGESVFIPLMGEQWLCHEMFLTKTALL
ncbi:MAG: GNAT family protein [Lachnospiraceae bacterium]|nr:GNAT family protein [Lachnospiraceae bacterium]